MTTVKMLGLVRIEESLVEGKAQRESNIDLVYSLSDRESIEYSNASQILAGFLGDLDLFGLVERNYSTINTCCIPCLHL